MCMTDHNSLKNKCFEKQIQHSDFNVEQMSAFFMLIISKSLFTVMVGRELHTLHYNDIFICDVTAPHNRTDLNLCTYLQFLFAGVKSNMLVN